MYMTGSGGSDNGGDKGGDGIIHTCSKCGAPTRIETFDGKLLFTLISFDDHMKLNEKKTNSSLPSWYFF